MLVVYGTEEPNNSNNQTIENNSSLIVNESEENIINETSDFNISKNMILNESMVNISECSDNEDIVNITNSNTTNDSIVLGDTLKINGMGNNTNNSALDNEPDMNIAATDEESIIEEQINETSHSNANNEIPAQAESEKKVARANFVVYLQVVE